VRVKRLQLARVIEMQSSSFAHQRSTTSKIDKSEPDWHIRSAEAINQRPMRPFLGRFFDRDNNEITAGGFRDRSEEHTSELQSRSDLVCRLLLEKKKDESIFPITSIEQI